MILSEIHEDVPLIYTILKKILDKDEQVKILIHGTTPETVLSVHLNMLELKLSYGDRGPVELLIFDRDTVDEDIHLTKKRLQVVDHL